MKQGLTSIMAVMLFLHLLVDEIINFVFFVDHLYEEYSLVVSNMQYGDSWKFSGTWTYGVSISWHASLTIYANIYIQIAIH